MNIAFLEQGFFLHLHFRHKHVAVDPGRQQIDQQVHPQQKQRIEGLTV